MISRTALLDELVKIGEESIKKEEKKDTRRRSIGPALRAMAVGAGGGAIGYALAHLMSQHPFYKNPHPGNLTAAKIILPILGGTATMLADRYRQKMNEQYSKVKGYGDRK
jgi:hypothetical protein